MGWHKRASQIEARGGTLLEKAIVTAMSYLSLHGKQASEPVIVLITDGQVAAEDASLKVIKNSMGQMKPRFFCLGIDSCVNHSLLNRISRLTGGTTKIVESEHQLQKAIRGLHQELGNPVLTDIKISSDSISLSELAPGSDANVLPDVFPNRPISLFGIVDQSRPTFELTVTGKTATGEPWIHKLSSKRADAEMLLALWGRERIRDLEDRYAGLESPDLAQQIVLASLRSNVLSRFTAYVAVDRERIVTDGSKPQKVVQPVEQPRNWGSTSSIAKLGQSLLGGFSRKTRSRKAPPTTRSPQPKKNRSRSISSTDLGEDALFFDASDSNPSGSDAEQLGIAGSLPPQDLPLLDESRNANQTDDSVDDFSIDFMEMDASEFTDTAIEFSDSGGLNDAERIRDTQLPSFVDAVLQNSPDVVCVEIVPSNSQLQIWVTRQSKRSSQLQRIHQSNEAARDWNEQCRRLRHAAGLRETDLAVPVLETVISNGRQLGMLNFVTVEGKSILVIANLELATPLSHLLSGPVDIQELLRHFVWLRSFLESVCHKSDGKNRDAQPRPTDRIDRWTEVIDELANWFSDSHAKILLQISETIKDKVDRTSQQMELSDIVGELVDESNTKSRRKTFWQ